MRPQESPVFVKTYDFVLWLLPHTAKFPRAMRHTLTNRLETSLLDLQGALTRAARAGPGARLPALAEADGLLDAARFLVRLSADLGYLSSRQYEFAAGRLTEIGRLVGGWKRSLGPQG